jgi:hypothetical protein
MSHARQQIRDAVVTAVTGLATTGSNVFRTRIHPLDQQSLPALLVYTLEEASEADAMGASRSLLRSLRVAIDAVVQQVTDLDDLLDDIAAEVETAVDSNAALNGLVRDITLDSSSITKSGEGEQSALGLRLVFTALYRTRRSAPETLI